MKITNLKKDVGNFHLDIKELILENGKIHGLIGANGCGKTTLSKLIMGIHEADEGNIDFEGIGWDECTMITQRPYLLHKTVEQNLVYPLKLRNKPIEEQEVNKWLTLCGLMDKKKQYARSLSSGERQKLSFARALIFSPKLIIIDETFSNLDPDSVHIFEELIKERQKENPVTWIIISHQLVLIRKLCDKVHFLEKGKHVVSGETDDILISPENEAVCRFLEATEVSFRKE